MWVGWWWWWGARKQSKRRAIPQELPIQALPMYHMRFLLASEGCRAFDSFGGIRHQFNSLSAAIDLAVKEGIGLGIAYVRTLCIRLEETAIQRDVASDEFPAACRRNNSTSRNRLFGGVLFPFGAISRRA